MILQHGTILINVDPERMFNLLRVPSEKTRKKMIQSAMQRVTSINDVLSEPISFNETVSALARGFEESLGLEFDRSEPERGELMEAEQIAGERYGAEHWNHMR